MPQVHINFPAVLAAAVANMIIGSIWYSPGVFGRTWMSLIGKRMEDMKGGAGRAYAAAFVVALILAYVLAHFVGYTQAYSLGQGIQLGFWVWLGFVATTSTGDYIFAGRPRPLYFINNGYHLVTLLVNGALLSAWR